METATLTPAGHTAAGGVLVGVGDAGRSMVIYEDPQCPYCRIFEQRCGQLLRMLISSGVVRVEYRMRCFLGPESARADNALALGAESGLFDDLRSEVFRGQPPEGTGGFTADDLIAIGRRAGLTGPAYTTGVREGRYLDWVERIDRAFQLQDPDGTPSAWLDGEPVDTDLLFDSRSLAGLLAL